MLTDGENTYSTVSSDPAGNKSTYAAYGYTGLGYNGTAVDPAVRRHVERHRPVQLLVEQLHHRAQRADGDAVQQRQGGQHHGDDCRARHVDDRCRRQEGDGRAEDLLVGLALPQGPDGPSKPAKLFWNATGATLSDNFKEIANELSNLRVVG